MKQSEILELMTGFEKSGLTRMEYEADGQRLMLEKAVYAPVMPLAQPAIAAMPAPAALAAQPQAASAQEAQQSASQSGTESVNAPLVGVFYEASAPGEKPLVSVGDKVSKGQLLCLIEAMKMINELHSPVSGIIKQILVKNEDVVSFGQKLFEVEPC